MGAHSCVHFIQAETKEEAIKKAEAYQESEQYENGHGAYSGHLGTAGVGVQFVQEFIDEWSAENWILDHHQKWDLPMLARVKGTDRWVLAGWCAN